ncbi:MAG TPA: hypothetical protein VFF93_03640, partial [Luteimonas sp.]|nr:hypothetical protein [Luteimonas sp.]
MGIVLDQQDAHAYSSALKKEYPAGSRRRGNRLHEAGGQRLATQPDLVASVVASVLVSVLSALALALAFIA